MTNQKETSSKKTKKIQTASLAVKEKDTAMPKKRSAIKKTVAEKAPKTGTTTKKTSTKTAAAKVKTVKGSAIKKTISKVKKNSENQSPVVNDDFAAAWLCAKSMLNKKGDDVIIIDLREAQSAPADFFVICSCDSTIQAKAVASEVDTQWRKQDWQLGKSEGWDAGEWIIIDYFDIVVHVFEREKREYFKLEKLWSDGAFFSVKDDGVLQPIPRK